MCTGIRAIRVYTSVARGQRQRIFPSLRDFVVVTLFGRCCRLCYNKFRITLDNLCCCFAGHARIKRIIQRRDRGNLWHHLLINDYRSDLHIFIIRVCFFKIHFCSFSIRVCACFDFSTVSHWWTVQRRAVN